MSSLVQTNFLANSSKETLQLETDEAAVISLLANQLSQQQTQLTGPVLQDEGEFSFFFISYQTIIYETFRNYRYFHISRFYES